ncbi:MAG TPA: aldo/keto reductase [Thermoplasmata archaeon]|nr:aldo/keto reductase [Thermoplasmata archaeon]
MADLSGHATREGTERFAERSVSTRHLPPEHFRRTMGSLRLSSIGLGTYLGQPDLPTDHAVEQSVTVCLTSGRVNVLDTAINYRLQRSERNIGRALGRLAEQGSVARDEVFVATKIGYLAPDSEAGISPAQWVQRELIDSGVLDPADIVDGSHAMSPKYLTDQFQRSRTNLGLETIDLLYLHNAVDAQLPTVGPVEFEARLRSAFVVLERFRTQGHLVSYGLATWDCLRLPPADPAHFDLERAVQIASEVGGEKHGFRFVQFPFNLAMREAAGARTQRVDGERLSLFEAARRLGVGCFTSVPLMQGQLSRNGPRRAGLTPAQTALQFARSAPGTLGPLVGQKRVEHLSENLEVASHAPWDAATFEGLLR